MISKSPVISSTHWINIFNSGMKPDFSKQLSNNRMHIIKDNTYICII